MIPDALNKIRKYLQSERQRGYDNRTIFGGLEKAVKTWVIEAKTENIPEEQLQHVSQLFSAYAKMAIEDRKKGIDILWKQLNLDDLPGTIHGQKNTKPDKPDSSLTQYQTPATPLSNKQSSVTHSNKNDRIATSPRDDIGVGLDAPLNVVQGIGPARAKSLALLELRTLGDLLYYFPRRYDDYSQLKTIRDITYGQDVTIIASVQDVSSRPAKNRKIKITEAIVNDGTSSLRLTWFNQPWIIRRLQKGRLLSISGRVDQYLGRPVINNPDFEELDSEQLHTNRIVPVYSLTSHITQRWLRNLLFQTVRYWAPRVKDILPEVSITRNSLVDLPTALFQIHFPDDSVSLQAARQRLSFDEIFLLQLGVLKQKASWQALEARQFPVSDDLLNRMIAHLPYRLTGAQECVLSEIRNDLISGRPMNRLLQGDVGAGKTVLAALTVAMVCQQGAQSTLMAPTSILATQHYQTIQKLVSSQKNIAIKPDQIRLLIGDTSVQEKEEIRQGLADGSITLVIGTHALIESPVKFKDLQLVIVDEQHRFGVSQRALLRSKGHNPHLLVMTATPIPRSLALTIYGDLDLSILDEMPPGRQQIETQLLSPRERDRAYTLIRDQVSLGCQAFIIYPLVEEGENEETKAAVEEHERLQKHVFPDLRLGLLHGRLKAEEKDTIMAGFRSGEYQVLVSTSVIEVGVDVPNATMMIIEGANRFGLAQLHQFRGRVGRGSQQSYCLLIPESDDALENERLSAMTQTNDGFILAEKDLEQRGPGDFLGTRQSGFSDLRLADLTDLHLIEKARKEAQTLFQQDPDLTDPEHIILSGTYKRFWKEGQGDIS
ncbi:MAG: ATP-dependent DNA helicase RecG [Anaerolineaceae bacterium]|nr:ATP-dependent DNA helicase RecG [Anaerolineaceae bacterium]